MFPKSPKGLVSSLKKLWFLVDSGCSGLILSDIWWTFSVCSFKFFFFLNFRKVFLKFNLCIYLGPLLLYSSSRTLIVCMLDLVHLYIWNCLLNPFNFFLIFKAFLFCIFYFLKHYLLCLFTPVSSSLIFMSKIVFISNCLWSSLTLYLKFVILVYVILLYLELFTWNIRL